MTLLHRRVTSNGKLRPEFDKRGVKVVTVSVDLPEVIAEKRHLHGIQATMLSDQALVVTDAFGLRNQGVHSAPASEPAKALPVPATLLVDRDGTVYGAICPENYQRRSDPSVVLAAMEAHFDSLP